MIYRRTLLHILALSCTNFSLLVNSNEKSPSIIIVGAGAAGIAAASKLFQNGFKNITILEAEDRIGGRIYTTRFNNYLADLGGQWVHGESGNIAFELASPLGLLDKGNFMDGGFELYDSSGIRMDRTEASDIKEFFMEIVDNITEYSEGRNGSIGPYFQNEFNKYFKAHPNLTKSSRGLLHLFDKLQMEDEGGDSWWDVSTKHYRQYYQCPGANQNDWMQRGYSTILDILMKRFPNLEEELPVINNTLLNTEVSLIYNDEKNGNVVVTTTTGETYFADHVIVTISLGVLKEKYHSLFKPSLSEEKVNTLKGLGFGSEAKIYLSFDKPWWKSKDPGFYFFWKDEDKAQLEKDIEKSWLLGINRFSFVEHKPGLLYGWLYGKYSRDMERISEQKVFNYTVEALHRFLGKYYNITMPTGMIRTKWNSNKYFKGTYSYFQTLKSDGNVCPAILAEPIGEGKPVILFAGEATHPHFFSTVHGAIETGHREATRLINFYSNMTPPNA